MQQDISRSVSFPKRGRAVFRPTRFGLAAVALLSLAAPGVAVAQSPSFLAKVREAIRPAGQAGPTPAWIRFCEQLPHECAVDTSEPDIIPLTQAAWDTITRVNERANKTIIPVTDQDHWGVVDRWDYPDDGLGDCEDIQLLKRKLLVDAGLPRRALRMTVVIDELGQGHAVLMARTDRGDFILDNKRNAVLPWQETGYQYVKREGTDGEQWVWLGNQAAPVVTANR